MEASSSATSTDPDTHDLTALTARALREQPDAGMMCVDTSGNPRIPVLMELVGAISRAHDPREVLNTYSRGMKRLRARAGFLSLSTRGLPPGQYRITRLLHDDDARLVGDAQPWVHEDGTDVFSGGFIGAIIQSAYPELIHNLNVIDDPVLGDELARYRSLMAVPLYDNGEPVNWAIVFDRDPAGYDVTDLEEQILRANLVGGTVRRVQMAQELRTANHRARREVDQIARIQRALLPHQLPDIRGLSLGAHYETFDLAGGDIYDFVPLRKQDGTNEPDPDGPWEVLIADAAGHGPAAATVVAMLNAILNAYPHDHQDVPPSEVLAFANEHLYRKQLEGTFVTAIFARYDPRTRVFTYTRAGHNPALLMRREGDTVNIRRLDDVGGAPLGVIDTATFESAAVTLQPGDTVVLYTDGVTEAASPDGTMFGVEGIERSLHDCSGEPDCVISHITTGLREHEAEQRPRDDQTLLVLRVTE